jgi:hypothetical protein
MKKHLQKITLLIIIYVASLSRANAQNWEYVGTPYINQTTSMLDYLYFADLEFNTAGDAFVGYWKYSQNWSLLNLQVVLGHCCLHQVHFL